MEIYLYDSMDALPEDNDNHIVVFAGRGSLLRDDVRDMLTEVLCTYHIGDTSIQFARNGDAENIRFEQAFSWAVKYAAAHGIDRVYGIYELNRPLDHNHMSRIAAGEIIDKRERELYNEDVVSDEPMHCPNCSSALSSTAIAYESSLSSA